MIGEGREAGCSLQGRSFARFESLLDYWGIKPKLAFIR